MRSDRSETLSQAYAMLREARKLCAQAGASKTLPRIRSAISSIKGAIRSAEHDCYRAERRP